MNLNAWLTLAGVVLSPVGAVLITLWIEGRRRDRESKMAIVRALITTRHLPADPAYSRAINLVRVEFANVPNVIDAYKDYQKVIRQESALTEEGLNLQNKELQNSQLKLLSAILRAVGMNASEADLSIEAYAARGLLQREEIYINSLLAQQKTADALARLVQLNEQILQWQNMSAAQVHAPEIG